MTVDEVELIMHNVGHGLAVSIIEHPTKYVTEIDLGSEEGYSPLAYLMSTRRLRTDVLYITHPHSDHLSDVSNAFDQRYYPNYLNYQEYDWDDVINRQNDEARDILNSFLRLKRQRPYGEYQGGGSVKLWRWTPENAKTTFGESSYINNSSLCVIYTWQTFKICICGDLETQAVESLVSYDKAKNDIKGYDILVAPHHGHKEGYTPKWVDNVGKPYVSLISVQSRDQSVASGYLSSEFAKGITFMGETRYALTTRRDSTIVVNMYYKNGKPTWLFKNE
ncbi:hypothetical protein ACFLYE_00970 [Chloroflexota bacterium]